MAYFYTIFSDIFLLKIYFLLIILHGWVDVDTAWIFKHIVECLRVEMNRKFLWVRSFSCCNNLFFAVVGPSIYICLFNNWVYRSDSQDPFRHSFYWMIFLFLMTPAFIIYNWASFTRFFHDQIFMILIMFSIRLSVEDFFVELWTSAFQEIFVYFQFEFGHRVEIVPCKKFVELFLRTIWICHQILTCKLHRLYRLIDRFRDLNHIQQLFSTKLFGV